MQFKNHWMTNIKFGPRWGNVLRQSIAARNLFREENGGRDPTFDELQTTVSTIDDASVKKVEIRDIRAAYDAGDEVSIMDATSGSLTL